jgi:LacI family transcriptional regulator
MRPTRSIGMLIPDSTNQFFSLIAQLLQRELAPAMYAVVVMSSDGSADREQDYIELLLDMDIAGLVFISVGDSFPAFERVQDSGRPVVVLDREVPLESSDFVVLDNDAGVRDAVEYLKRLGHQNIACIGGNTKTEPGRQRIAAFTAACETSDIKLTKSSIVVGDFTFGSGSAAAHTLLTRRRPPTAVFACNDLMALGALQYAREHEIAVPAHLSIVGFDDIAMASWVYPRLTTVRQDCATIARVTAELLVSRVAHVDAGEVTPLSGRVRRIEPLLVERESCAPPASLSNGTL